MNNVLDYRKLYDDTLISYNLAKADSDYWYELNRQKRETILELREEIARLKRELASK